MSKTLVFICVAAVLVAAALPASAITIRNDRKQQLYLDLGALPQYASVGRIDEKTAGSAYIGSGTLIDQDWVLTAAHMVDDATALTFTIGGNTYAAAKDQWFFYPSWTGDLLAGYDIGLVKLETPVTTVAPAVRYTGSAEFGTVGTMVGFGMTGTGKTGAKTFDGQKRGGQNMIDSYVGKLATAARILLVDFDSGKKNDNRYGLAAPLNLEGLIAPGDSGGGLFIGDGAAARLAGVTSFIGAFDGRTDSDYGDVGGFTRVSAFNSWIDSYVPSWINDTISTISSRLGAPLAELSLGADGAVAVIPEPASLALLVLGLGAIAARRRCAPDKSGG